MPPGEWRPATSRPRARCAAPAGCGGRVRGSSAVWGVLVGEVVSTCRGQAEAAGILLSAEVPQEIPLVEVDPLRIREVLANLTANALRHTPPTGLVRITAALAPARPRVILSVIDTGRGVPPGDLPPIL